MSKGSILVVDDESEIREGLELLLSSEGYGVSSADTGESGLAKLEEQPFDLAAARRQSARSQRPGPAARDSQARSASFRRFDHRLRLDRHGAPGVQERRAGLHHQAVVQRRTAGASGASGRIAPAARRKRPAQARAEAALQFPKHYRQERKNADAARPGHAGRAFAIHGSDQRRKRHRQRTDRQSHPLRLHARGQGLSSPSTPARFPWTCWNRSFSGT